MGRGPTLIGRAPAHLTVLPGGVAEIGDDERTTIEPEPPVPPDEAPTPVGTVEEQWEDGTTVAEGDQRLNQTIDEPTVEDQARPLPPLQLVPAAADPRGPARLHVIAGSDHGRVFDVLPGKELQVGRAVDNDVVLTDISVSRHHLELSWDGDAWVLRDRGSGNGTLINDRLEDGRCQLRDGDRIEIGNTVFRFDHPASAAPQQLDSWGQEDEEASTVAGRSPPRPRSAPLVAPAADHPQSPPRRPRRASQLPPPRGRPVTAPPPASHAAVDTAPPASLPLEPGGGAWAAPFHPEGPPSGPVTAPTPMQHPSVPPGAFGASVRPMTMTARVDPRPYLSQYPHVATHDNRRRNILIGAVATSLVALVGVAAMLVGGGSATRPSLGVSGGGATATEVTDPAPAPPEPVKAADVAVDPDIVMEPPVEPPVADPVVAAVTPAPAAATAGEPGAGTGSATDGAGTTATGGGVGAGSSAVAPPTTGAGDRATQPVPAVATHEAPVERPAPPPQPAVKHPAPRPKPPARTGPVKPKPKPKPKPKRVATAKPARSTTAEKKAASLYRSKDYKGAAAVLRDAAASADAAAARRLKATAKDYETVGKNLAAGGAIAKGKPIDALAAFKRALAADRRVGSTHARAIGSDVAKVAPAAAALYMAKHNYPAAKLAADDAANFGSGSSATVANVRASLERKAGEFYASAQKLKASKPAEARGLLRTITKIVPASSTWYSKAYKQLNARKTIRDEDE